MNAEQPKKIKPIDEFRKSLTLMEPQFKVALPSHIPVEKFIRVVQTAIGMNPDILRLDRTSLFSSCMTLAQQGLLADNREAALVAFDGKVVAMPMIAGILKKIRNSGELATILSEIVFENDIFDYWIDDNGAHVNHKPYLDGERGEAKGVYALAKTKDGELYIEYMSASQVQDVKEVSKAKKGPWSGPFAFEMWRKSVTRRLAKRLPMSTDAQKTIDLDDEMYTINPPTQDVTPKRERKTRLNSLLEAAEVQTEAQEITPVLETAVEVESPI